MGEFEHVVMLPANDPVTSHFGPIGRREAYRDGIVMHVQSNKQDLAFDGPSRSREDRNGDLRGSGFLGGASELIFAASTGEDWRSMYVFMVSVFLSSVVWGVSPQPVARHRSPGATHVYSGEQTPYSLSSPSHTV